MVPSGAVMTQAPSPPTLYCVMSCAGTPFTPVQLRAETRLSSSRGTSPAGVSYVKLTALRSMAAKEFLITDTCRELGESKVKYEVSLSATCVITGSAMPLAVPTTAAPEKLDCMLRVPQPKLTH